MVKRKCYTIQTIWGLAKSPELSMSGEELHLLVTRETGKESIKLLNQREIRKVVLVLADMKQSVNGKCTYGKTGNKATTSQRRKVYKLVQELGWEDDPKRINGFVRRMFRVDRLEWLNDGECGQLIEALKQMVKRKKEETNEYDGKSKSNHAGKTAEG